MFTHHAVTIMLLSLSYTINATRVGSLVLGLHDAVDAVLEVRCPLKKPTPHMNYIHCLNLAC